MPKTKQQTKTTYICMGRYKMPVATLSWILIVLVGLLAGMYLLLLAHTTMNVAVRKAKKTEVKELQSEIAQLESQYFARRDALSLDLAKKKGFVAIQQSQFAYRNPNAPSVAYSRKTN